jgi:hypothetical protein
MKYEVKSTVLDYQTKMLEITDWEGTKHTFPWDTQITVTMIGFPATETKTMIAHELGAYMEQGYAIIHIEIEDTEEKFDSPADAASHE